MSNIKEVREFFLRNVSVTTGAKRDRELNFPLEEMIVLDNQQVKKGNRFLSKHFPSSTVFSKLFNSLPFKLNTEDTITEGEQGLARYSTTAQFKAGTDAVDGFGLVPKPSQIKELLNTWITSSVTVSYYNGVTLLGTQNLMITYMLTYNNIKIKIAGNITKNHANVNAIHFDLDSILPATVNFATLESLVKYYDVDNDKTGLYVATTSARKVIITPFTESATAAASAVTIASTIPFSQDTSVNALIHSYYA